MSLAPLKLLTMRGKIKILHMSWIAFFISFVIWFNHAPLMMLIKQDLGISDVEVEIILLLNVALTIPARVIIGLVIDRYGAKISYSALLAICSVPCFMCALADNVAELAWTRFLLGFIGAGFVVGVRIIGGWLSDRIGRKLSLSLFTIGLAIGYLLMAMISENWSISLAVLVTLICSIFMQAAEGAIFAFVPLIRCAITGEVAGIVGAYGNAGAIIFLIALTFISPTLFFSLLGVCCLLLLGLIYYLEEPRNFITQIMPNGNLIKIELE